MPKSASFATCSCVSRTLPGFTSRCTRPCACAAPERVEHLLGDRDRLHGVEAPAAAQQLRQALAVDELEHEVRLPVVLTDVVDRDRVGMVEAGGEAGFAFEPGDGPRIADGRAQELDRDRPPEPGVGGGVHVADATDSDAVADLVPVVQRIRHATEGRCRPRGCWRGSRRLVRPARGLEPTHRQHRAPRVNRHRQRRGTCSTAPRSRAGRHARYRSRER